jgi:glycosyltransferase involved in cell wall biosynthesis
MLRSLYGNCRALIFPQEEDWGIAALEAQSCGRPVLAYAKGGALESVIEGKTGHFFYQQTPEAIMAAVQEFEVMKFEAAAIRENALQYDREVFKSKIKAFVEEKYREYKERQH